MCVCVIYKRETLRERERGDEKGRSIVCAGSGRENTDQSASCMRFRDLLLFIFVPVVISADSTAAVAGPVFVTPVGNQTAAIGREAIFSCSVRNIGKYKVRYMINILYVFFILTMLLYK